MIALLRRLDFQQPKETSTKQHIFAVILAGYQQPLILLIAIHRVLLVLTIL